MFMRIFRYRVRPEMQDRHLALQARAAQLYGKYVEHAPVCFRSSADRCLWVELHRYADRDTCRAAAKVVGQDPELASLWMEFQDSLDSAYPSQLEEFDEIELPSPLSAPPYAQPPIDVTATQGDRNGTETAEPETFADDSNEETIEVSDADDLHPQSTPLPERDDYRME